MPEEPATSLDRDADTTRVGLRGEVDIQTVDQVRRALSEAVEEEPRAIVVDLSALTFIDSTGLGALMFGFQRARDAGIAFRLAHAIPAVRQILVVSGLLEVVELDD